LTNQIYFNLEEGCFFVLLLNQCFQRVKWLLRKILKIIEFSKHVAGAASTLVPIFPQILFEGFDLNDFCHFFLKGNLMVFLPVNDSSPESVFPEMGLLNKRLLENRSLVSGADFGLHQIQDHFVVDGFYRALSFFVWFFAR
jgi:hypothetical protein